MDTRNVFQKNNPQKSVLDSKSFETKKFGNFEKCEEIKEFEEFEISEREMLAYRQLACAVILQWIEDYFLALRNEIEKRIEKNKNGNIKNSKKEKRESLESLEKWPWTSDAEFWCEVAGHDVKKLQNFALELKTFFINNDEIFVKQQNKEYILTQKLLKKLGRLEDYQKASEEETQLKKRDYYWMVR